MLKHLFFILFLMLGVTATAQNKAHLHNEDSVLFSRDINPLLPAELSKLLDANVLLNGSLKAFKYEHLSYNSVLFASIFIPGDSNFEGVYSAMRLPDDQSDATETFQQLSQTFFNYKSIFETLYAAAMPYYQAIFKEMTPQENKLFLDFFQSGLAYSQNFDLSKEKADLAELGEEFAHSKGKLKAFIYRRIANNQLSKEECIYWLKKIVADLTAAVNKSTRPEDQYILLKYPEITNYYHWAYLFEDGVYEYGKRQIIHQKPDTMGVLFTKLDDTIGDNISEGMTLVTEANGKEYLLNYTDGKTLSKIPLNKKYKTIKDRVIYYEDGTADLLLPQNKQYSKAFFSINKIVKTVDNQIGWRRYAVVSYADGSYELLLFDKENGEAKAISMSKAINNVASSNEYIWVNYNDGQTELINNQDFSRLLLPKGYTYASFSSLKNALRFSVAIETPITDDFFEEYHQYGILSKDGNFLLEPRYNQVFEDKNFILFSESKGIYEFWGVLDANCKQVLAPAYFKEEFPTIFDPETFEEIGYTPPDQRYIFYKPTIKSDEVRTMTAALIDADGKLIIPDNLGYIERVELKGYTWDCYYLVNNKVEIIDYFNEVGSKEVVKKGKYALFDNTGKALTGFVYDSISFRASDEEQPPAYFICRKGKKTEKIDVQGNKM